jgi:aryl-alcohol dehydrogenase-like predicted oxidoreductase
MPIAGLRTPAQADASADALLWQLTDAERNALDRIVQRPDAARMPANPFQSS